MTVAAVRVAKKSTDRLCGATQLMAEFFCPSRRLKWLLGRGEESRPSLLFRNHESGVTTRFPLSDTAWGTFW